MLVVLVLLVLVLLLLMVRSVEERGDSSGKKKDVTELWMPCRRTIQAPVQGFRGERL